MDEETVTVTRTQLAQAFKNWNHRNENRTPAVDCKFSKKLRSQPGTVAEEQADTLIDHIKKVQA